MSITLRQLQHARALARHGNFREAAIELDLTQPALTRSIQALERALGIELFDRLPTGVEPTPAGALLLAKSSAILQEKTELEREIRLLVGLDAGSLKVSMGPYPGHALVPRTIAGLLRKHPGLSFQLRDADWISIPGQLLSRESDIAVGETSLAEQDERLGTVPMGQNQLFFACRPAHPLTRRRRTRLTDVLGFPWAGCRSPARMGDTLGTDARSGTIEKSTGHFIPAVEVDTVSAAKQVAAASNALMAATLTQLEPELNSGQLALLRVTSNPLRLRYGFMFLKSRSLSPAARAFTEGFRGMKTADDEREGELRKHFGLEPDPVDARS